MDKKELKFYAAPACEVVELKLQSMLCGSPTNAENAEMETPEEGEDL